MDYSCFSSRISSSYVEEVKLKCSPTKAADIERKQEKVKLRKMVRDFSKRVLLKIRNIFHKQIREGIGLYQYTTWIFLENFVEFLQLFCGTIASNWVWMSYWSINNVFPVEAQFYLKNFFVVFLRNLETFSKKLFAKKLSFNWLCFIMQKQ